MDIIKCNVSDAALLQKLSTATFTETFGGITSDKNMQAYLNSAYDLKRLQIELARKETEFYICYIDGEAAGHIKINEEPFQTDIHDENALELERIYVLKKHQGKGVGSLLMNKVIVIAKELGKQYIWLGAWEHNEKALQFYKRNGFYRIGEHDFIMGDDVATDWILRKDLN